MCFLFVLVFVFASVLLLFTAIARLLLRFPEECSDERERREERRLLAVHMLPADWQKEKKASSLIRSVISGGAQGLFW